MNVIPFRPLEPDPRNGFFYACESYESRYDNDIETETFAGFVVVHMADDGDSAAIFRGYRTLADAQVAARRVARDRTAEMAQRATPDEHYPDIQDHTSQLVDAGILPDLEDCV
jgi:hypothetical protein